MVYIYSLPSLVHHYWASFALLHFPHWCIITGHGLYCFTSCFIGSSLLGMVCADSRHASPVHPHWEWFVLLHFPHWWIITGQGLYCSTSLTGSSLLNMICIYHFKLHLGFYSFNSRFTGYSLLGMVYIVSLHTLLVPPYWSRFVLFYFPH
jgi:hypothetical protein